MRFLQPSLSSRCVESIFPLQFQSSQVFADGLWPMFPRSSLPLFRPGVQCATYSSLNQKAKVFMQGIVKTIRWNCFMLHLPWFFVCLLYIVLCCTVGFTWS